MKVREIRKITGLSQQKFGDKYKIPKRTIENWESETSTPPEYVILLLERAVKDDFNKTE